MPNSCNIFLLFYDKYCALSRFSEHIKIYLFYNISVESHRTAGAWSPSCKQQSDSREMRKPIKNQTQSFGKAWVKATLETSYFKQLTDSEKMTKQLKQIHPVLLNLMLIKEFFIFLFYFILFYEIGNQLL